MEDRQQHILKLEEDATKLVDGIGLLKKEVESYKTATAELDKARVAIVAFLGTTEKLTQQTHQLLATINEIGSSQIFAQLEAIKKRSTIGTVLLGVGLFVVIMLQILMMRGHA